jgi:hypothetical protein
MNIPGTVLLILVSFCISITPARGQANVSLLLSDCIHTLQKNHQVTFLYDHDLITNVSVNIDTSHLSDLDKTIEILNAHTAFEFITDNTSNILVKPRQPGFNLKICGTIIDSETLTEIPGVTIYDEGKSVSISSNVNGYFSGFVNLAQMQKVKISSLGYEATEFPIEYFNGTGCPTIRIKLHSQFLNEVVINAYLTTGIDYRFKDNSIVFNPNGTGLLPNETDADILMTIDALPGISSPDSKAGNLLVRGSSPDQTLITFDDIPIYHKGHYFGTISPYNPAVVDQVKIYRSAYPANRGGRVGGVIEIDSRRSVPDSAMFGVGLSTTYASAFTEIPLKKNKASILMAGRTSLPSDWTSPKLETINEFIYQESAVDVASRQANLHVTKNEYRFNDINAKIITRPWKNNELLFSVLGIDNQIGITILNENDNSSSYDKMNLRNLGYNIQWLKKWNQNFSTSLSGTQSTYDQSYISKTIVAPDTVREDAIFENELSDYSLKLKADWFLSPAASFNFGYELQHHLQRYKDYTVLNGNLVTNINQQTRADLHSVFLTYNLSKISKYIFTAGVRTNYYAPTRLFNVEPRISLNYFINNHWTVKSSGGIFHQYVTQISGVAIESVGGIENLVWQIADEKRVPVVESHQAMVGGMFHKNSWLIDLELYRNEIDNIAINNIINFSDVNSYLYGNEKTEGADLLIKKDWTNFSAWTSYTLSKSEFHFDSIQSESFSFVYDQRHRLDVVIGYTWHQWKISAGWKYRSGLPVLKGIRGKLLHGAPPTPPRPPSSSPPPPGQLVEGSDPAYNDRFPNYHQLDVSLVYTLPKERKGWRCTVGLSLLNVYNNQNVIEQIIRPVRGGHIRSDKYAIGFAPNVMVSVNW